MVRGEEPEGWGYTKGQAGSGETDLAIFFLKLNFTRKGTDGLKRRFRSLTKIWSSEGSLSTSYSPCVVLLSTEEKLYSIPLQEKIWNNNFIFILSFQFILSRDRVIYLMGEFGIEDWKWWMGAFWPLLLVCPFVERHGLLSFKDKWEHCLRGETRRANLSNSGGKSSIHGASVHQSLFPAHNNKDNILNFSKSVCWVLFLSCFQVWEGKKWVIFYQSSQIQQNHFY